MNTGILVLILTCTEAGTSVYYMHFKLHAMLQVICMQDNVFYSLLQPGIQVVLPRGPFVDAAWRRTVPF